MSETEISLRTPVTRRTALKTFAVAGGSFVLGIPRSDAQQDFDPETSPGKPAIAPALADAIYHLTDRRIRSLPISSHGLDVASA